MVSEGARLSSNLLKFVLSGLANKLEKDEGTEKENTLVNGNTKEGKQKINELLNKHESGIQSLDENLTKQQVKDYQKELKKLGVDFSVTRNGKDNYSFFFAGGQADVIEKGIKNVLELKTRVASNEQVK